MRVGMATSAVERTKARRDSRFMVGVMLLGETMSHCRGCVKVGGRPDGAVPDRGSRADLELFAPRAIGGRIRA